ncbi:MAG: hypothetical protein FD136_576 [Chitinophagaceae bacterium]|nr:MAG: hypothetical protein FD136_576 [Chitinophagaceae bacterium]
MIRFIQNVILFIISFGLVILIISYFGDAGALFYKKNNYESVAKNLLNNKFVFIRGNIDERLLQKEIILNLNILPETIVLGSSRVMQLSQNISQSKSLINNGVSGCSIEDIAAIINLYETKFNTLPKNIVLGLDPWSLNINNEQKRYYSILKYYKNFFSYSDDQIKEDEFEITQKEIFQLFNPSFFSSSLKSFLSFRNPISISDTFISGKSCRLPDLSIMYDKSYNNPTHQQLESEVKKYLKSPIYSIENFSKIDDFKLNELRKIIKHLIFKKCMVTIVLSPYHQRVYNFISNNFLYKNVVESEKVYKQIAKDYNIILKGSFNPNLLHVREEDFLDGMHINKETIEDIFLR